MEKKDFVVLNTKYNRDLLKEVGFKYQFKPGEQTAVQVAANRSSKIAILGDLYIVCFSGTMELINIDHINDVPFNPSYQNFIPGKEYMIDKDLYTGTELNFIGSPEDLINKAGFIGTGGDIIKFVEFNAEGIVISNAGRLVLIRNKCICMEDFYKLFNEVETGLESCY